MLGLTGIDVVYACAGLGALCAAVLPTALAKRPLSLLMVFLAAGFLVFLLPSKRSPISTPFGIAAWWSTSRRSVSWSR